MTGTSTGQADYLGQASARGDDAQTERELINGHEQDFAGAITACIQLDLAMVSRRGNNAVGSLI